MSKNKNLPVLRNLIYSLVLFGQIKTTKTRAKAVQGVIDRLINKTKKATVASKRDVLHFLPEKPVVEKLAKEIVPGLSGRNSGYTKIVRLGRRPGDGASMVLLEWVVKPSGITETGLSQQTEAPKEKEVPQVAKPKKVLRKRNVKTDKTK